MDSVSANQMALFEILYHNVNRNSELLVYLLFALCLQDNLRARELDKEFETRYVRLLITIVKPT